MKKINSTPSFGFHARPFGLRALLEAPATDAPAAGAPAAPAVVSSVGSDEVSKILRAELPKAVGEAMAKSREESIERANQLDAKLEKLSSDFRQIYRAGVDNPVPGKDGLLERGLILKPHESVEEFVERHQITSGRVMFGGAARASGGAVRGRAHGLAGVRDQRGITAARMMRAFAAADRKTHFRGDTSYSVAADHALKVWGDKDVADMIKETEELQRKLASGTEQERAEANRALGTTTIGNGSGFVKPDYASFFMDYLFSRVILFELGATSIPLKNELTVPFLDTAVSAAFRGEASGPNASQPTEGTVTFVRKLVTAIVAMTNEWLDEADYGPDAFLRNHLARALASHVDLRAFRGRGTANELRGVDYWVEQAGVTQYWDRSLSTGSVTFAKTNSDLLSLMQAVTDNDIDLAAGSPGYALPNAVFYGLMRVLAGTSLETRPFRDELRGGTLNGAPVQVSTQFPVDLVGDGAGSGTNNKTNIYFADWSTFAVGQSGGLEIKAMDGAAYKDANGATQLGFTNNETVIRADMRLDTVALRRGFELARLDSVDLQDAF
jgi:hypothetical protein